MQQITKTLKNIGGTNELTLLVHGKPTTLINYDNKMQLHPMDFVQNLKNISSIYCPLPRITGILRLLTFVVLRGYVDKATKSSSNIELLPEITECSIIIGPLPVCKMIQ